MPDADSIAVDLAVLFEGVDGVAAALPYEPAQAPDLPLVSVLDAGFRRAGLATSRVQDEIRDPLGGRAWVWLYRARLWVDLSDDEQTAQRDSRALVRAIVLALEGNPRLNNTLDDSAIASGETFIGKTQAGQAVLLTDMDCQTTWTEPTD